jgi:hypothetical protein
MSYTICYRRKHMIDHDLAIIRGLLSAEAEAPPNELHIQARIRRNTIAQLMEAIEAELQPVRAVIQALPALPPEPMGEDESAAETEI